MLFHRLLNDYSVTDAELLLTSCQKVPTVFEHREIHKFTKVNSAFHVVDWHYFLDRIQGTRLNFTRMTFKSMTLSVNTNT